MPSGIGLALLGAGRGYRILIFMPATQSREKIDALRVTGAEACLVPAVPYKEPGHHAHQTCAHAEALNLAGVGQALKAHNQAIRAALADPAGSALAHYVRHGELLAEGGSISEGIGSSRIIANFAQAPIDLAWSIPGEESGPLVHQLLHQEGWGVGGTRYQAKLFNPAFLQQGAAGAGLAGPCLPG